MFCWKWSSDIKWWEEIYRGKLSLRPHIAKLTFHHHLHLLSAIDNGLSATCDSWGEFGEMGRFIGIVNIGIKTMIGSIFCKNIASFSAKQRHFAAELKQFLLFRTNDFFSQRSLKFSKALTGGSGLHRLLFGGLAAGGLSVGGVRCPFVRRRGPRAVRVLWALRDGTFGRFLRTMGIAVPGQPVALLPKPRHLLQVLRARVVLLFQKPDVLGLRKKNFF